MIIEYPVHDGGSTQRAGGREGLASGNDDDDDDDDDDLQSCRLFKPVLCGVEWTTLVLGDFNGEMKPWGIAEWGEDGGDRL